eukprot:TRINITY_DN23362_c0_g2_i1.p1 TRINITY_DN23362_c0_g2~~TRINITY_DN23362_c0_g2_i1.p1  ORF type:complete len:464 (+),score=125.37 TRINITY_DN23362_c0_g2_i1:91-1482(+)
MATLYKGLMIDVARHFLPIEMVLETLDLMKELDMNALHVHFSDDQGFPVQFSEECNLGKFNERMMAFHKEGFFTEEDLRSISDRARSYGIQVIPEVDLPGHQEAFHAFYYGNTTPNSVMGLISDHMMADDELEILLRMLGWLGEVLGSSMVHIGCDECNGYKNYSSLISNVKDWAMHRGLKVMVYDDVVTKLDVSELPRDVFVVERWRKRSSPKTNTLPCVISWGSYLDHLDLPYRYYRPTVNWMVQEGCLVGYEACLWSELVTLENYWSGLLPNLYMCAIGWNEVENGEEKSDRPAALLKKICDLRGIRGPPSESSDPFQRRRREHFYRDDPRSTTQILRGNPLQNPEDKVHVFDRRLIPIFEYVERWARGEKVSEEDFVALRDLAEIPDIFSPENQLQKGWKGKLTRISRDIRMEEERLKEEKRLLTFNALRELCNFALRTNAKMVDKKKTTKRKSSSKKK